jgi:rotatin
MVLSIQWHVISKRNQSTSALVNKSSLLLLTVEDIKIQTDWRFPWISLADSDRHVLATTNTRLQSNNTSLAKKSCEFLSDVLFKDFPAEIFIQRPSIVMVGYWLTDKLTFENAIEKLELIKLSSLSKVSLV